MTDTPRDGVHPNNTLNDRTGKEWLFFTKSVLRTSYPRTHGHGLRREHGANKPPLLMQHIIEFFTKPGGTVLDPFAGVGGTLLGASLAGRRATGIEINPHWLEVYRRVCRAEAIAEQETIAGDCRAVLPRMARDGRVFDLIATDPPYSVALAKTMCTGRYDLAQRRTDFDRFSDDAGDLRNLADFAAYYDAMEAVARLLVPVLVPGGYCAVLVRDSYQQGRYVFASAELSRRFERAGFCMKGCKVWYGTGARVRPYGYPRAYVPNIVHQNILIFRREDPSPRDDAPDSRAGLAVNDRRPCTTRARGLRDSRGKS